MASSSTEIDSEATISDTVLSDVPADEIPPPILDAEEEAAMEQCSKNVEVHKIPPIFDAKEEVAMEQSNKEVVDVSESLKDILGIQVQDWIAIAIKRIDGRTDKKYIHKDYLHKFRSILEVKEFVTTDGIEKGTFRESKLRKKRPAGVDAQDAGTSKCAGRSVRPAKHARSKHSLESFNG